MSDTRYPTRMHEVLGVEAFERFQIKGLAGHFFLTAAGQICPNGAGIDNDYIIDAINHGIIHLPPPLTDEQREQLRAIWTLGGRWIAQDETGNIFAYGSKPQKIMICSEWHNDKEGECFTVMRELSVCAIVSWSDPEPFDIGKALEVEG